MKRINNRKMPLDSFRFECKPDIQTGIQIQAARKLWYEKTFSRLTPRMRWIFLARQFLMFWVRLLPLSQTINLAMQKLPRASALACFVIIVISQEAFALPIGFGINQGDLDYDRLESQNHRIYHDARAPTEAQMIDNSLTAVKPIFRSWFGMSVDDGLIINTSAASNNASFANFLTNSIELQTLGQGSRDLFWHEYTHTNMYQHFFNIFGPAGSLFHLPWMPAWFIEGLAEAMSVSVGSDMQVGIERYQALTKSWPSYDRLHSLYNNAAFSHRGYATSGAFVAWILRQGDPRNLPKLLDSFYDYTMPWWWAWIVVPFNGFTPIDGALKDYTGYSGFELYEQYKKQATAHWKSQDNGVFISKRPGKKKRLSSLSGFHTSGNSAYLFFANKSHQLTRYRASFNKDSGWLTSTTPKTSTRNLLPSPAGSLSYAESESTVFAVTVEKDIFSGRLTHSISRREKRRTDSDDAPWQTISERSGVISRIFLGTKRLAWFETEVEATRMCWLPLARLDVLPICRLAANQPSTLAVLGSRTYVTKKFGMLTKEIWLSHREQTLIGDRYTIIKWWVDTDKQQVTTFVGGGKPISLAVAGKTNWLLVASGRGRLLRKVDEKAQCQGTIQIADLPLKIYGLRDGSLVLGLYEGGLTSIIKLNKKDLKTQPCYDVSNHTSPLIHALHQRSLPNLKEALASTDPWVPHLGSSTILQNVADTYTLEVPTPLPPKQHEQAIDSIQPKQLSTENSPSKNSTPQASVSTSPAPWKGRPVFLLPFVGANDALGSQYGFVSIPLMDHQQNETIRFSFLYGSNSDFPSTDISFLSTRFWPTLTLDGFRKQIWNGIFYEKSSDTVQSIYMDEIGAKIGASFPFRFIRQSIRFNLGMKVSNLKKYMGPFRPRAGQLNEGSLSVSYYKKINKVSWSTSLTSRATSKAMNTNFDYNVVGGSTSLGFTPSLLRSRITIGLSGSRTRGKRMRELRETYSPLKTFVPGSGGGYNQNSWRLTGTSSLLSTRYGDTKIRSHANWTFPVNGDIDTWVGIAYIERLDFTAFFNYGGTWYQSRLPPGDAVDLQSLIAAHGYNLDLQLNNKGVRFNVGLGTGQVIGRPFEAYAKMGFDALF